MLDKFPTAPPIAPHKMYITGLSDLKINKNTTADKIQLINPHNTECQRSFLTIVKYEDKESPMVIT
jgi:hypothetical protein